MKEKVVVPIFITLFFVVMVVMSFVTPGTGDSGDSLNHYLYAKYAFVYPVNFFDTWAKPFYVLLASPFAQFGFIGIKLFNVIIATLSMAASYLIAKRLQLSSAWLVCVFLALAPLNIIITLSGLTEPLFACVLMCGLCFLFYEHIIAGLIILSFLAFVRSEGFFMLIPVIVYLIFIKRLGSILWLVTGQVFYAFAGYFFYKNLLWFYNYNPYHMKSQYGQGSIYTYITNMPIIIGLPLTLLLVIGIIVLIYYFFVKIKLKDKLDISFIRLLIVAVLFVLFFIFHSISWGFGLFSSYGMLRYIVSIVPLIAIICVYTYNRIFYLFTLIKRDEIKHGILLTSIIAITFLPISNKINYYNWDRDFGLQADQIVEKEACDYVKKHYKDYKNRTNYFDAIYPAVVLDVNPFDGNQHKWGWNILKYNDFKSGSYYIWDDWYSVVEGHLPLEKLLTDSSLVKDSSFSVIDSWGNIKTAYLFRKK